MTCHGADMRWLVVCLVACTPGGVKNAEEVCAKASAMYAKCDFDMHPQAWELTVDRWRGICRALLTGETKQLLPDGLMMYESMPEDMRAGLKEQALCHAKTTTCLEYHACEQ